MKAWTKEEALRILKELADESDRLMSSKAFSTEHTMWLMKSLEILEEVFGRASRYYLSFAALKWHETGSFITEGWDPQAYIDAKHHTAFRRDLGTAKGFLLGAASYLAERELSDVYDAKDTGPEASLILKVLNLAEHQLRKVIREKPDNER